MPKWVNPETSTNRVFIRRGRIYLLPPSHLPDNPELSTALKCLSENEQNPEIIRATPDAVQICIMNKIKDYPERAEKNMHRVRVRVPIEVGWVLKNEPCLVSLAVEGFYDRDVESMKYADKMERFLPNGKNEEVVRMVVKMSRAMYAQLMGQTFRPPKRYPQMPSVSDNEAYKEAELGMKIACGLEMMYQLRKRQGEEGKGSTWEVFMETLEKSGYFDGLLPGSNEYKRLLKNAEEYYQKSSLHYRASEILGAPVRRIEEILSQPHSADDFKVEELPPSDDDSWFYGGEDELNTALKERQEEMELFYSKKKRKEKVKEDQDGGPSDCNLEEVANSMKQFVHKIASYEGAEVPESRNLKDMGVDLDNFMKDMESAMRCQGFEGAGSDIDLEEGSSSDMDFDDSEDDSEDAGENVGAYDPFMCSYSDMLNKELKATTLDKTFIRVNDRTINQEEGTSNNDAENMEEDLSPLDVDVNLVKNLLDSFSSQQGLPGPASNLLGLMGLKLPEDNKKAK